MESLKGIPVPEVEYIVPPKDAAPIEFYHNPDTNASKVRILDVVIDVLPLPTKKVMENGQEKEYADTIASRFIPKWESMKDRICQDTPTLLLLRDMAIRMYGGVGSRVIGPTGVSKSTCAEVLCALTNRNFLRHGFSRDADVGDIIGRFVPKESKLAASFEELLHLPNFKTESAQIVHNAQSQSRSLTILESKIVARNEGLTDIAEAQEWVWKNGTLTGTMIYQKGGVFNADEIGLAPANVRERMNSAQERYASLRLVEHEAENVRGLSEEEQDIIDHGGIVPGVIGLGQYYWYVATENPWGIGGGRTEPSEAEMNRLQTRVVPPIGTREYEDFLYYEIKGDQPTVTYMNRAWPGAKDVATDFNKRKVETKGKHKKSLERVKTDLEEAKPRDFKELPKLDIVIKWMAKFQDDLDKLGPNGLGKIGTERDIKGGSYIYTRRNLLRFLDSMRSAQKTLIDVDYLFKTGKLRYNDSWTDHFWEGLNQEYLMDMYQEDREAVMKIIEASGIMDYLGPSKNNPKAPEWIKKAKAKGMNVTEGQGEYEISKLDLTNAQITVGEFEKAGYRVEDLGDNYKISRELKGAIELWSELFPEASARKNVGTASQAGLPN